MMREPLLTYLMPTYAAASWYGLLAYGDSGRYMLPISLFGWLWAGVNIARSRRFDLGIVTFAIVLAASIWERKNGYSAGVRYTLTMGSIMVAASFSLVVVFWTQIRDDLSKSKSRMWLTIFWSYCACMMLFWVSAAYTNYMRGTS